MEILFLGHSLVEYFDWQRRFPAHRVRNLGVAGETTGGLLARIDGIAVEFPEADVVLVMTGTNDVLMEDRSFLEVYRLVAHRLREHYPGVRIVLHAILPANPEWVRPEVIERANREIEGIARGTGAEFFDLAGRFMDGEGKVRLELLTEDGVHLSEEGYRVRSEALEEYLDDPPGSFA